jgi:hypothetical protein
MTENEGSQFSFEAVFGGGDVRVVVDREGHEFGTLVLNERTICWIPDGPLKEKMGWLMPWEQFAKAMQSMRLGELAQLSQCAYTSGARAEAKVVRPTAFLTFPSPDARERLGLRRKFNAAELTLIRKGYTPQFDERWILVFDATESELRMHRSWTGECIYCLNIQESSEGGEIVDGWVNRDPEKYSSTNLKYDAEVAEWLIDVYLLGRERESPDEPMSDEVKRD